ncbi:spore coat protein U domain-containing protein [Inquilinus sp. Marseille-Q2685]|uniref:spore coat protein U domain-containing protein n=1 Tax=Inquilinus sp. Marseille-Q2685 TaxID=2866581 RepID=UPI001CE430E2|nr:spore coat protein U domain-containing protein [Inquilinus sp. Marseille-Q2685]
MRSSYLIALAGTAIALVLAAGWLPARAQEAPQQGPAPTAGLGALPGDNAPGTAGPRVAGASALRIAIPIEPACSVDRDARLTFPGLAPGGGAVDGAGSVAIDCTRGLPYLLALDAGGAPAVPTRLYSDPGRRSVWGDRPGIDTVPGSGTGAPVTVPLYARAAPAAGAPAGDRAPVRLTVAY